MSSPIAGSAPSPSGRRMPCSSPPFSKVKARRPDGSWTRGSRVDGVALVAGVDDGAVAPDAHHLRGRRSVPAPRRSRRRRRSPRVRRGLPRRGARSRSRRRRRWRAGLLARRSPGCAMRGLQGAPFRMPSGRLRRRDVLRIPTPSVFRLRRTDHAGSCVNSWPKKWAHLFCDPDLSCAHSRVRAGQAREGGRHVVDHCGSPARSLGAWPRELLHPGRIHSPLARAGHHCAGSGPHPRSAGRLSVSKAW